MGVRQASLRMLRKSSHHIVCVCVQRKTSRVLQAEVDKLMLLQHELQHAVRNTSCSVDNPARNTPPFTMQEICDELNKYKNVEEQIVRSQPQLYTYCCGQTGIVGCERALAALSDVQQSVALAEVLLTRQYVDALHSSCILPQPGDITQSSDTISSDLTNNNTSEVHNPTTDVSAADSFLHRPPPRHPKSTDSPQLLVVDSSSSRTASKHKSQSGPGVTSSPGTDTGARLRKERARPTPSSNVVLIEIPQMEAGGWRAATGSSLLASVMRNNTSTTL